MILKIVWVGFGYCLKVIGSVGYRVPVRHRIGVTTRASDEAKNVKPVNQGGGGVHINANLVSLSKIQKWSLVFSSAL